MGADMSTWVPIRYVEGH